LIIPVVSGYGPRVSVGDTAQAALTVPGVVVVVVVVAVGLVDEPPQADGRSDTGAERRQHFAPAEGSSNVVAHLKIVKATRVPDARAASGPIRGRA
jgi:hypothetical protein